MVKINFKELQNKKFNRLTIIREDCTDNNSMLSRKAIICECECGKEVRVLLYNLKNGHTKSCGCLKEEHRQGSIKHNLSTTRICNIWHLMKSRCYQENCNGYESYGGRGIVVCPEWLNDLNAFYEWAIKNGYKENLTLDRVNNNGNYEPSNCRWVTKRFNSQYKGSTILDENKARGIRMLIGAEYRLIDIAKYYGITPSHVSHIKNNDLWRVI